MLIPWFRADGEEKKEVAGKKGGGGEVVPWGIEKWWRAHVTMPEVPTSLPHDELLGL